MAQPALKQKHSQDADTMYENIQVAPFAHNRAYLFSKRAFDIVASLCALVVLSPLMAITALAIKLEDGGSVIYLRKCVGRNERPIDVYKFRSMIFDADNKLHLFTPEQKKQYEIGDKFEGDPRVTKVGRVIRKTSIDELPQLLSILKGDMSLIGPRPVTRREADVYGTDRQKLLSVRPGLTGYWQVMGRDDCAYLSEEARSLQLYYIDHMSVWFDIRIMLRTVLVVLSCKNAR